MQQQKNNNPYKKVYKLCPDLFFIIKKQFRLDITLFKIGKSHSANIFYITKYKT